MPASGRLQRFYHTVMLGTNRLIQQVGNISEAVLQHLAELLVEQFGFEEK